MGAGHLNGEEGKQQYRWPLCLSREGAQWALPIYYLREVIGQRLKKMGKLHKKPNSGNWQFPLSLYIHECVCVCAQGSPQGRYF